jgi:hypothetical protein
MDNWPMSLIVPSTGTGVGIICKSPLFGVLRDRC